MTPMPTQGQAVAAAFWDAELLDGAPRPWSPSDGSSCFQLSPQCGLRRQAV